jgi:hypothetical protein
MRALLCMLGLGAWAAAAAAPPPALLRWEQSVLIAPQAIDGLLPRELSALAWDEAAGELVAASDRGLLFRFTAHDSDGQLVAAPRSALRIEQGRNAEALHTRPSPVGGPEQLWMLTETGGTAVRLGARGEPLESRPWPMGRSKRNGAEALAWLPGIGLVVALQNAQRPQPQEGVRPAGAARALHAVQADGGRRWAFDPAAPGSHVKAIEALPGGRLLVLERVPLPGPDKSSASFRTVLRLLALQGCGQAVTCRAPELPVLPPLPDGPDNFEGLACAADGRCWIVNDSGPDAAAPTRLLQLRLEPR